MQTSLELAEATVQPKRHGNAPEERTGGRRLSTCDRSKKILPCHFNFWCHFLCNFGLFLFRFVLRLSICKFYFVIHVTTYLFPVIVPVRGTIHQYGAVETRIDLVTNVQLILGTTPHRFAKPDGSWSSLTSPKFNLWRLPIIVMLCKSPPVTLYPPLADLKNTHCSLTASW